jgi:uncharacterized protein (DUF934 family)
MRITEPVRTGWSGGDALLDKIPLMLRCGFDSFGVSNEPTLRALKRGYLPGVSLYYQPSVVREAPAGRGLGCDGRRPEPDPG